MTVTILILIYVCSIFLCRYAYKMQYVWGHWDKKDAAFSLIWIVPYCNTITAILYLCSGYSPKKRTYKHRLVKWFTNQDL